MSLIKSNIFKITAIFISFSSEIAFAVENNNSDSPMTIWPLLLLVAILFVFRKQLFAAATAHTEEPEQKVDTPIKKEPAPKKTTTAKKTTSKAKETKAKEKTDSIDLNDDSKQCQASTAKGSRCKRTTTLEKTSVTIDGTTYHLTVCSQHNNDALKPFLK